MVLRVLFIVFTTALLTACYRHDGVMAPVVDVHPHMNKIKSVIKPRRKNYSKPKPKPKIIIKQHDTHSAVWQWPVHGKVIHRFSTASKGLDIAGHLGQSIKAAAAGVVIYAGNGLRGYGNLLIIKHNSRYLSAYAYNQNLLVKVNQRVKTQQAIATMGRGSHQQVMLHFEIRRMGRPVDPRLYLGKRRL